MSDKKIKVAFRLNKLSYGGAEQVFISVADYLRAYHGFNIDVVVDNLGGYETEELAINKGVNIINLKAKRTFLSIFSFYQYLKAHNPDIVFSAYTDTNAASILSNLINMNRTRLVITEHSSLKKHWENVSFSKKVLYKLKISYLFRLADHVVCVSNGMLQELKQMLHHSRMSYIYNPVRFMFNEKSEKRIAREKLNIPSHSQVLLSVGRVAIQKNYLMLLKALNVLNRSNTILYIVGSVYEKSEKDILDRYIHENGLLEKVVFVDFTHDINQYYSAADVFVLSSAWEGFGNVIVEALAFGLPVVSTNCNFGPEEILSEGKYGKLVPVGDHCAMATAINEIFTNNPFTQKNQVLRSQEFHPIKVGSKYHQLICELLDE